MSFNINTATKQELMTIKGVGSTIADRILMFQEKHGFNSLVDLTKINGVKGHIFGEVKAMGIYCKDPKEEGEKKMKEDIRTLFEKITKIFKAGYLVHGQQWSKEQMVKVKKLWNSYMEDKDFENKAQLWDLALEAARQEFLIWKEEMEIRIYGVSNNMSWQLLDDRSLVDVAEKEAWRWYGMVSGKYTPPVYTSIKERELYWQMVQVLWQEEPDSEHLAEMETELMTEAVKIYFDVEMRLCKVINDMFGLRSKRGEILLKQARIKARNMWGKAIIKSNEMKMEDWADDFSEKTGTNDNLEDLTDGLDGEVADDLALEGHQGQMEGFVHEPNWFQIFYMQNQGYDAFHTWQDEMRKLLRAGMRESSYQAKKEVAEIFKDFNKFLWDLHQNKDNVRTNLMMMDNPMGMIKKTDLQTLSKNCCLAVKCLFPKWTYQPKPILSYEEHMARQNKVHEAKVRMRERSENDEAERSAHQRQKEMNTGDLGRYSEDGWHQTEIMDEYSDNQEQVLMEKEIWF